MAEKIEFRDWEIGSASHTPYIKLRIRSEATSNKTYLAVFEIPLLTESLMSLGHVASGHEAQGISCQLVIKCKLELGKTQVK